MYACVPLNDAIAGNLTKQGWTCDTWQQLFDAQEQLSAKLSDKEVNYLDDVNLRWIA